ncbi:MAG: RtcB family protein [Actinomycetota bacterium]|nr:RtcB family protein [Actinomycetota bacterium]
MARVKTFGGVDERSLQQLERCMETGDAEFGVLCADHHPGYSQPIGGAIAYPDHVSPSGVGYDIGCIAAGTEISTADGYTVPIETVAARHQVTCWDGRRVRRVDPIVGAIDRGRRATLRLTLADGRSLQATLDHRIRTKLGWREASDLRRGDLVAAVPHVGLPYEPPADEELDLPPLREPVSRPRFRSRERGLRDAALWPVRTSDERFPALLRLVAYCAGDGHLSRDGRQVSLFTSFEEDVAELVGDLREIGFEPRVYSRDRGERVRRQWTVRTGSVELHALLAALGCPVGKKTDAWPEQPMPWLHALPAWARATFLSAFMSAEGLTPRLVDGYLAPLTVKQAGTTDNAIRFLARLFESLGYTLSITRSGPVRGACQTYAGQLLGGAGETVRYLREIGFSLARSKRVASAAMLSAQVQHEAVVTARRDAVAAGRELVAAGIAVRDACARVSEDRGVPAALVFHGLYGRGAPRAPKGWRPTSDNSGEVAWLPVRDLEPAGEAHVFDVVTGDPAESFLANGMCVHNCGNKAVLTDVTRAQLDAEGGVGPVMDEIARRISFGMGVPAAEKVDHPVLEKIERAPFEPQRRLAKFARDQLGTVGSGNHYVNVFEDERGAIWVGVHFGSRGFGHRTASGFLALAQGRAFDARAGEGGMDSPPVLIPAGSDLGQAYVEAMSLAGEYAYAGRDVVVDKVLEILGARAVHEVHNHHNFAWREEHFGRTWWVVRKGCTPAYPGQEGFVGGSMGEESVILEGVDGEEAEQALRSTVHGAGRVMSRRAAAGKVRKGRVVKPGLVDWPAVQRRLREQGIHLVGGGADEAPEVYKRLGEVLAAHAGSIRVKHRLRPLGVAMAGRHVKDPYRD